MRTTGEESWGRYERSTLLQVLAILVILCLLSVVAVPRYMDTKRDMQREAREAEAHEFIRALHGALTDNTADHYLRGVEWVGDGERLMGLLEQGRSIPQGMRYADNVWTDETTGLAWEFKEASDGLPPRIRRIDQRPSPDNWEMEPIGRGLPQASPPDS